MTKFAEIIDGKVVMISFDAKTGWPAVDDSVFPGDTDNGDGTFSRPPARPKYSLESAKAMILEYVKAFEDHVTGLVSTGEQLSWADKEVAAIAFQDGTATAEQLEVLQDEADETGETLAELAALIVAKGKRYRKLVRKIAGLRRATYMALEAEEDPMKYKDILNTALARAVALADALGVEPLAWEA